ncbi:MAG: hypothetical protein KFB95_06490 [Simkaniaceae bacterium]|nr:MAG: hypothetical protein KFB95_06490 [Simkaniaceae bacterium]
MEIEAVSSEPVVVIGQDEQPSGDLHGRSVIREKSVDACFNQCIFDILNSQSKVCSFL